MARFADIQALLVAYLAEQLGGAATVATTIPAGHFQRTPATPLVQVLLTGGVKRTTTVDAPQITIDVWADTDEEAAELSGIVRDLIPAIRIIAGVAFYRHSELGRPVPLPDPRSDRARYRQSHILTYRAARTPTERRQPS